MAQVNITLVKGEYKQTRSMDLKLITNRLIDLDQGATKAIDLNNHLRDGLAYTYSDCGYSVTISPILGQEY